MDRERKKSNLSELPPPPPPPCVGGFGHDWGAFGHNKNQ